ncbi:MAG TPA: hypothetical protein VH397_17370 [Xanthobacteraceae bacterium]|jgi:regulator of RNase E activity RraA
MTQLEARISPAQRWMVEWRLETVEINGAIQIGGVRVYAGDLVVADDTGVCFHPA